MHTHVTPIDIRNNPELMRLAEEVARTKKPRELMRDRETVAILMPATAKDKPKKKRVKTQADYEAFRAAAGSWKDMDVEKFKADIYESRRLGSRPPIKL
jgi:hypothetical protein